LQKRQNNVDGHAGTSNQAQPLNDITNEAAGENQNQGGETTTESKPRAPRPQKQRGPPEDGIPSKNKVMVANLPYDLGEDKVTAFYAIENILTS
jgi:hypothetical protein